ncbi:D-alanyl-D-alanine carboxypeptidase/D-alanyl-D-alanine-endopeptidase [Candidatus Poribacteria bacterium]|nr:MAG: D-alanyl-D-alanine carboxypeptidase/D-alanyl-D-alanine-endopeptidase [Candidatus Poribacteria bacterium]
MRTEKIGHSKASDSRFTFHVSRFRDKLSTLKTCFLFCTLLCCTVLYGCGTPSTIEVSPPAPPKPSEAVRRLQAKIEATLNDPLLASSNVGMKVASLGTGEVLYEKDAEKLYHPASTMKLITAATALIKLSPNYRFRTTLYADRLEGGRVMGNIYLKGGGDPVFNSNDLGKMVDRLVEMDTKDLRGDIVVDETYFDAVRRGKGWMWDDGPIGGYYPHLSALTINRNGVLVRISPGSEVDDPVHVHLDPPTQYMKIVNDANTVGVSERTRLTIKREDRSIEANVLIIDGAMTIGQAEMNRRADVLDPALYCGTLLREMLAEQGVTLYGTVRYGEVPEEAVEIIQHISPPLSRILWEMNKPSDNLIAELLLKTIGAELRGAPGTAEKGLGAIGNLLGIIGMDRRYYTFADGSGVSRYNLVTASLLTDLLVYMYRNFAVMPEYLASLPVGGVDGTLTRRMRGMSAEGILRAKTGTLRGLTALAGYTVTADGETVAFSIIVSNYLGPVSPRRVLQDKIGDILTQFSRQDYYEELDNGERKN